MAFFHEEVERSRVRIVSFFLNSFPHLMQAAFFSHQAVFLYERKHVCCVAGPKAALFCKINVAHIFEGVFC